MEGDRTQREDVECGGTESGSRPGRLYILLHCCKAASPSHVQTHFVSAPLCPGSTHLRGTVLLFMWSTVLYFVTLQSRLGLMAETSSQVPGEHAEQMRSY